MPKLPGNVSTHEPASLRGQSVTDNYHVFLSYSRNDLQAAANLRGQLERHGLSVFKDDERIRAVSSGSTACRRRRVAAMRSSCWWAAMG